MEDIILDFNELKLFQLPFVNLMSVAPPPVELFLSDSGRFIPPPPLYVPSTAEPIP